MGRSLSTKGGNDNIQTPIWLAKIIVEHFKPNGRVLEPCCGDGNFLKFLPDADWCEINRGRDFFKYVAVVDWIITNPPYSKYRQFLEHGMKIAKNIVFLQLINATFYKARLKLLKKYGFGIREIWCIDTPKEFPQFGFQMGCVYYKYGYVGDIRFIY